MTPADFTIKTFNPDDYTRLGAGMWGEVYDLGDGTVLKTAKLRSDGLGDGRVKMGREYLALELFQNHPDIGDMIAQPRGMGDIPPDSIIGQRGFDLWLRMTKVPGKFMSVDDIAIMTPDDQRKLGTHIGHALARLHLAMQTIAFTDDQNDNTGGNMSIPRAEAQQHYPDILPIIDYIESEYQKIPDDIMRLPGHGDFNSSNLMFDNFKVVGILDFAEWGRNYPEKDIGDIINECPWLAESMIAAYEETNGFTVDRRRVHLAILENAIYGAIISHKQNNQEGIDWALGLLREQSKILDFEFHL